MLKAEVEGRPYTPAPPSSIPAPLRGGGGSSKSSPANGSRNGSSKNLDEWGTWDGDKVRQAGRRGHRLRHIPSSPSHQLGMEATTGTDAFPPHDF